ncbi:hypothetical protein LSAT2_009440 [Lamellibrachia satsuma]|nr:hypothetical protein LSAT2_009440 [Lamellibrachia satsuma]
MEHNIQHLIDALNRLPNSSPKHASVQLRHKPRTSTDHPELVVKAGLDVDAILSALRQRMRKLRRWRNGSESWSVPELEDLVDFLLLTKASVVTYRFSLLLGAVDALRKQWQASPLYHDLLDDDLSTELSRLTDGARILHQSLQDTPTKDMSQAPLRLIEEKLDDFESSAKSLKRRLCCSDERRRSRALSDLGSGSRRPDSVYSRIEEDPLVNRLLKNDSRLRRLINAFRRGKHVTLDNGCSSQTCAVNDTEVLERQLCKLERWRQCEVGFTTDDLDDLELIVSAIECHCSVDVTTPDAEPTRESIWGSHNEEEKIQHKTEPDTSMVDTRLPLLMSVELDDDTDVDAAAESLDLIDERLI